VQPLCDFFGVAFVVELEQAGEDFTADAFADGEAEALLGLVEVVAELQVVPAVGGEDDLFESAPQLEQKRSGVQ